MRPNFGRAALVLAPAQCLSAQDKDLTSLSLEDFLNTEATWVGKIRQKLSRGADIGRGEAASLPEAPDGVNQGMEAVACYGPRSNWRLTGSRSPLFAGATGGAP